MERRTSLFTHRNINKKVNIKNTLYNIYARVGHRHSLPMISWSLCFLTVILLLPLSLQAQVKNAQSEISVDVNDTTSIVNLAPDTLGITDSSVLANMSWKESLKMRLDTVVTRSGLLRTSQFGLMVYDLTAHEVVYALNERHTLRPASTLKLITAISALDKLGGAYQFRTRMYMTGSHAEDSHTLHGNIYIVGGMDPRLTKDDITAFVETIKSEGIDTIHGNICGDRSMKISDLAGEGWCWDDDNPILSPLVYDREDYFMEAFANELANKGIVVTGKNMTQTTPSGAQLMCTRSHPIDHILRRMMKDSDNLYAECMYYNLALAKARPARPSGARQFQNSLITKIGLNPQAYRIVDGSGLSLYNYVSPELEIRYLKYAYDNPNIYAHLFTALPVAGVDGTLAKRMRYTAAKGNVSAKTGTLTGVSSLAGYANAANGHLLAFCIINQGVLRTLTAKNFQDKICEELCK